MTIGVWEALILLLIVLLIFGAGKLPKVMGDAAKGIKAFKAGLKDHAEDEPQRVEPAATASATAAPVPPAPAAAERVPADRAPV